MRVKIISSTNEREAELQTQQAIADAEANGEVLHTIKFSTAPAVVANDGLHAFDPPDERTACWYSVLLIFKAGDKRE